MLQDGSVIHKDLSKLEESKSRKLLKFNEDKCEDFF